MHHLPFSRRSISIQTRLIVYYTSFALATLSILIYFSYTQAVQSLRASVDDKLETIAALKIDSLNQWVDEQRRNAIFLSSLPELRILSGQLLNDSSTEAEKAQARLQMQDLLLIIVQRTADFQDIQILDPEGRVVISMMPANVGLSQADQPYFIEGTNKTSTQTFYRSELLGETTLTIATPLFDNSQKRVGVLALHFNMKRVDDIFRDSPGLNASVQTHFFDSNFNQITNDPLLLADSHDASSYAIFSTVEAQEGSAAYVNHHGVRVIGRYFWLEEYQAILIIEIDEAIALGPAERLAINIAVAGVMVYFFLVVIITLLARRITAPLRALNETVTRISAGQLDATAPVHSDDEVGSLARAFNSMTEKLRQTLAGLQQELNERKLAENELLQFRKVMDESSDAIYMIDPDSGRYVDFNRKGYKSLGYSREELAQMSVTDVEEHFDTIDDWHSRVEPVHKKGEVLFETVYRCKDGTRFPVEVSALMLNYGERTILVASVRDITERRITEAALRESEERFRKVFQSSPVAICITTLQDGRLLDANYAYWDLTGYDPNLSIGRSAAELKMWDNSQERVEFVRNLKQKKSLFNADDSFYHTDGSLKQVISFYELIQINHEECILAMFYDMSAQKKTMLALQQSEARIRALLGAFPDMILELAVDGTIISVAPPKGYEATMSPELLTGHHIRDIFSVTTTEQTLFAIQRAGESNQIHMFEFEMKMGEGDSIFEARLLNSSSSTVLMLVRDITQRKWIEAEREKLIHALEVKNKESETLRESLASIVTTFDLEQVVERILDQIKVVIPYDTASVWRVDNGWQTLILSRDLPSEIPLDSLRFRIDGNNSSSPIVRGEKDFVLSHDVQAELPDFQGPHSFIHSWLAVPLKKRGRTIGLIALDGRSRNQFTEHHAVLAVSFANQVSIALENAHLFEDLQTELRTREKLIAELEKKNAETETMRESLASLVGTLEPLEVIRRILDQIKRVVPYDSVSVWHLRGNQQVLIGERGLPPQMPPSDLEIELDEKNHAMPIFREDVPYLISNDVQSELPRFQEPPHTYINSWLGVPLKARGKVVGLIALDGFQKNQFNQHHAQLAVTFADHVAIALENARLFSDLQSELVNRKDLIAELEAKNSELERFTYTVSHDLKSPLFTIRGFLGYLEQDAHSGNTERLRADIQRITDATDKMQRLLNELLELSRIGRLQNEYKLFSFEELAHEAAELVHGRIMERGITVHIDKGLPMAYGDRPRLLEVLQNLMDNAAKFMGTQADPQIEIGQAGEENGDPIFYVRDNGIGIAPEHFDRVFGLFNKLDPRSDGTGIGLALVKRIIEVHGGRIWVQSQAGTGSTFFFTLQHQDRGKNG
jgi:PAS domain S-box-containing protein